MATIKSEAMPQAQDVSSKEDFSNSASSVVEAGRQPEEEPFAPVRNVHGMKWVLAYASLISTVLFYSLDGTIVADIQPSIVATLGESDKLPWIGVAIALGTIAILPLGKAYGIFNAKWLFLSCVTGFEVGSALCGAAPNMNALIVGRVIQGVAGCGCYSGALTYISMTTSKNERPLYLSGVVAMWGLGSVLGPIIGGAFAQSSATWRWAFYINLVVAALVAPALILCLPNINPVDMPFLQKLRTQDWVAIVVFLGGAASLTMAITFGGVTFAFQDGSEIALWTVTGVLLVVFILVTWLHPLVPAENRLYPIHLMKRLEINILQYAIFVASGAMMITLYYTPLIFQFTRSDGPLLAGVRLLPFVCLIVFFGIVNGALMPKFGYYMPWYVFGNAMILIGSALMLTIDANTSTSRIYGYTAVIGAGVGSYVTAGFAVVQALIPLADMNNAVGFMAIGQMMGQIALLSVAASLYQNIGANKLHDLLPTYSRAEVQDLTTGRQSALFQTLSPALQTQVIAEVTLAIRNVFAILVAASALGFIGSLFLKRHKLY
ncbi:MFS general substrate transporter [Aspergillus indologenus CBS 114.80]|uniref:MFS general substrate transporter n=1 Tax=Aspergillus indologenus CBS 114.80 TaxID=1450541 RepID=A0A2V5IX98_9EURO|nr:MFS general substrate transporter [Aspergillus indologenus CBS 114.80]